MPLHASAPFAPAPATLPSRFAAWKQLESAVDRYASYSALGLGLAALAVTLVVL